MAIEIEFERLTSPLSSILANPSSSASTHQTNHGLTEPVRDGEADDEKNRRWGQQRMEDSEDGGWRVDPIHGGGGGAPIHSRFGNKWATIARFHNGRSTDLFLPLLLTDVEHWYCVVVNLVDKWIEVLDSMVLQTTDKKIATVTVVGMLFNLLSQIRIKRQLLTPWNEWHVYEPEVPQQSNTHDCGFYTLKFMEHWMGGWMNTRELEDHVGNDAIVVRKRLLVWLLLSPHNQLRDAVLARFVK
ncbi:hypothetical protein RHGRI_014581 [Rhododendron griersonianum]|uniref:Ubiquitin-like protease family profile domain-containing protein n=1 Tax=Rhododendron griersonianum TaxID=479676 RepID=A0AAV6K9Y6_9ERIC|nr:hypothetical protein RHGRI_014581 [Rhododendron griersonianum]